MTGNDIYEQLQSTAAAEWVIIAFIVVSLYLISDRFDNYISKQHDTDPYGRYDAWFVVAGVAYTSVGIFVIFAMLFSVGVAYAVGPPVFLIFGIAIAPMIRVDMKRAAQARQQLMEEANKKKLEEELKEWEANDHAR